MSKNQNFSFKVEGVCDFMQAVAQGLSNPSAHVPMSTRDKSLGDRSTYIGASSATGCLFKAYMDIKEARSVDSKQIFVFERGHQLEEMIRKGLNGAGWTELDSIDLFQTEAKQQFIHQEEIEGPEGHSYLKAHIDFVFVNSKELVIKEIKSSSSIPLQPYMSHVYQTMLQMWLLKNKYPTHNVRASVVYHNWDTGESIDYVVPFNEATLEIALTQSMTLWNALHTGQIPEPTLQLYCSKCAFKATCPKLCFGAEQNLPDDLVSLAQKVADFKAAEKDVKKLKGNFQALMESAGINKAVLGDNILEMKRGRYGHYLTVT
ncbi:MAG: hypothetical protein COB67_00100 [SAR324 cluster bacterium]|uniref:DUF83 domain-containing protein n=1 Tax=SAR324 cluster bacterium TaxID=2024889 RepID=A0A2A4TB99_9DELT|nr:MAG: hypothetical protein COB67_00100 [SAR324 cluster bacterium]